MTESAHKPQNPCPTTQTLPPQNPGSTPRLPRQKNGLGTASLVIAVTAWVMDLTVFLTGKAWLIFGGAIVGVIAVVVGVPPCAVPGAARPAVAVSRSLGSCWVALRSWPESRWESLR